ncbi:hypothetical protein K438DRAFT_1750373 [Mycena galopus ATCC 62051]|nr:hypothetical protein K438DRAFT_1750373 [Mycena galopus ATCC 62051]
MGLGAMRNQVSGHVQGGGEGKKGGSLHGIEEHAHRRDPRSIGIQYICIHEAYLSWWNFVARGGRIRIINIVAGRRYIKGDIRTVTGVVKNRRIMHEVMSRREELPGKALDELSDASGGVMLTNGSTGAGERRRREHRGRKPEGKAKTGQR